MSPEVFANTEAFDGFAIDLWAAGVILYIMLTGFPPYDQASRTDQRFDLIVNGRLVDQLRNWDIVLSDEVGDLLQCMLVLDPRDRLNLAEVMGHPWVTTGPVQAPPPAEPMPFHRGWYSHKYKRAGVVLFGIVPNEEVQLNMFHKPDKHKNLMKAIDALNQKAGYHKVRLAAQGKLHDLGIEH